MEGIVAGIDIGGTNTKIGIVNRKGNILSKSNVPTTDYDNPSSFVEAVIANLKDQFSILHSPFSILSGLGIGAPNGNYYNGAIELAPNLRWKGVIPLAKMFKEKLSIPVALTNDAKAAALGEMYFGNARGLKHFIFITLGTGLGSGFVVDGKLVYGHDGFAGEFGHTIIIPNGRPCGCGRKGCLEQYCSATGIVKTYYEILRSSNPDLLHDTIWEKVDSEYIFERALSGDEDAFYAFSYTGDLLGLALANAVVVTSPQAIFISGGLMAAGEMMFSPTLLSFEKNIMPIYRNKVKLLNSALGESDGAILGAASLIWNEIL